MRCIGIDYGAKRIGVAYGDELGVATPLPAIADQEEEDRIVSLLDLAKQRRATDLVFGYPYNMDGSVGFKAREVDSFIDKVLECADFPVHRIDERLTTQEALKGFTRKRDDELRRSGKIDSAAATLILQDFLNQRLDLGSYEETGDVAP